MANKFTLMAKIFRKVMFGDKYYTSLVIPNMYRKNVYEIDYTKLKKRGYKNLIFDIDNTILPVDDKNVSIDLIKLFKKLKKDSFNIIIVSNNNPNRVEEPAKVLEVNYLSSAKKPSKESFDKALSILDSSIFNTVMIGDQMLSDIAGAKEYGLYTILVDPLENKHNIQTKTARILQNKIEKKLKKNKDFIKGKYY